MIAQSNDREQIQAANGAYKGIVERLRYGACCKDVDEAADMLEFFFGQLQMHSPKMDGRHCYRFRGGWPMTHCVGLTAEDAVRAAVQEVKQSKNEAVSKLAEIRINVG